MRSFVLLVLSAAVPWSFLNLWLTPDQQGRFAFERHDFTEAAALFEDPFWKGTACYRSGDWNCAIDQFARLVTPEASFNLANAYAQAGEYTTALEAYDQALQLRPGWSAARNNRELVAGLIPAEQQPRDEEQGQPQDPTFDPDEIRFDEKGDQGKEGQVEQSLFSEEQIAEMWLRSVQSTPADFLRLKFAAQAANRENQ